MTVNLDFVTSTSAEGTATREGEAGLPSKGDIARRFFIGEGATLSRDGGRLFTCGSLEYSGGEGESITQGSSSRWCRSPPLGMDGCGMDGDDDIG
jgi:hypothetical protein